MTHNVQTPFFSSFSHVQASHTIFVSLASNPLRSSRRLRALPVVAQLTLDLTTDIISSHALPLHAERRDQTRHGGVPSYLDHM